MTFDYDAYFRQNCTGPLCLSLFLVALVVLNLAGAKNAKSMEIVIKCWALIFALLMLYIQGSVLLKGGIFLLVEKEKDAIPVTGVVEETVELPSWWRLDYDVENNQGRGEAIVVGGQKYHLTTYGDIKVGDTVSLQVLPKSKFVLRMDKISDGNDR